MYLSTSEAGKWQANFFQKIVRVFQKSNKGIQLCTAIMHSKSALICLFFQINL